MTTTATWATGASGDWNTPGNWSGNIAPNNGTIGALIDAPGSYTVSIAGGAVDAVDAVTLGDPGATLAVAGTINFSTGSTRTLIATQGTVTLSGSGTIINATTIDGLVDGAGTFKGALGLTNQGTLASDTGGNLFVTSTLTNAGTLLASNGFFGVEGVGGLTNLNGGTLTGGTYISQGFGSVDNLLVFGFNFDANFAVDAANIVLDGVASEIEGYSGATGTNKNFQPIEQQLQTIAAGGTLQALSNRGYTTTNALTDAGLLVLQGGTLSSGGLSLTSTGALTGFGVVNNGIANQGVVTASGGALDLTTALSGSGTFAAAAGSTLILNGATAAAVDNNGTIYNASGLLDITGAITGTGSLVVQNGATIEIAGATSENVAFSGSGATLKLDNPIGYSGTLAGFAQGDTLVLEGAAATKAFVSGSSLVVMNNGATIDTIQLAGSYAPSATFNVVNSGNDAVISNLTGAPLQQDFQFSVNLSDPLSLGGTLDAAILQDLSAAAQDWAQYITGHTTLRIQLNIVGGSSGAELATGLPTIDIPSGQTLDGRSLDLQSSVIALTTGNYVPGFSSDITVNLFAGNLASLYVNPAPTAIPSGIVPSGLFDLVSVFRHELGHGFGFGGLISTSGSLGTQETLYDHYIQKNGDGSAQFIGPHATTEAQALFGSPIVQLTTLSNGEAYGHFANSAADPTATDLMSGTGFPPATQRDISSMDLAVLQDAGVPVTTGIVPLAATPRIMLWTGANSSNFAIAGNWNDTTDGLNPAASAPGSIDAAEFISGGGTITSAGTAATLLFAGANAWTVSSSASLVASGGVNIGTTGTGTLSVNGAASITSQGTIDTISGASDNTALVAVGGKGTAWNSAGELIIGDQGNGTLVINQQATASATAKPGLFAAVLGAGNGGEGSLHVTGTSSDFIAFGQLNVGQSGTGHLLVENQGTVRTGGNAAVDASQGFDIAEAAGGAGDVSVTGNKSLLTNTGRFVVGGAGFGSLAITAGGTVITTPGSVTALPGAVIASQQGSDGSGVDVSGAGSGWQIAGLLSVGSGAAGSLSITAGGEVNADQAVIGELASGSGVVSVIGTGSTLTLSGQLTIGDSGAAEFSILGNASVAADNVDIALNAGSTGNVDIEGAGSHLDITNNLNIGGAGVGVLTLGNGTELTVGNNLVVGANGVLNQFGGSIDPSTITIVSGGRQGGHGTSTASVMISNAGTLFASGGTETVITPLITAPSGKSGVLEVDAGGDMLLNVTSVEANQSVTFTDGTGILTIGTIGGFAASIVTVNPGDQIIVQGKSIASDSFNASSHVLTLFDGSSATIGTLQLGPSVDGSAILANGTGGLGVAPCFAAGTRISTERGEVAVEDLQIGDRVQVVPRHPHPSPLPFRGRGSRGPRAAATELPLPQSGNGFGSGSAQPITWIGHRTVDCTHHPKPHQVHPVRVSAHAFGPNRPSRDLYLSPDHALFINDVLIPVKHLINGITIVQTSVDTITYYHVELPAHDVLLAENLPAESYLDTGDRSNFANSNGPVALYPDFASRVWDAAGCAPLVVTGPQLEAARRWVNSLSAAAA